MRAASMAVAGVYVHEAIVAMKHRLPPDVRDSSAILLAVEPGTGIQFANPWL